ncbi:transglutaminase domain-containing protein, partial [Candidatus Magnetoovum chiemensis]
MDIDYSTMAKIVYKFSLLPILSIPLTAVIFLILPRTDYHLLDFLNRGGAGAQSGFTDNINLGDVSNIQNNDSVIFRASMNRVPANKLYWRGIVMEHFDGKTWTAKRQQKDSWTKNTHYLLNGKRIKQTIFLEPYENKYLFALDTPVNINGDNIEKGLDYTFYLYKNVDTKMKYEALSVLNAKENQKTFDIKDASTYLALPQNLDKEILSLVKDLIKDNDEKQKIKTLTEFLKTGQFKYSLENLPVGDTALKDFLFTARIGNCEYFASSLAVMLRLAGIPSKVIGGYKGGYYNNRGGYYLVTQKKAHVWVEAYTKDAGWIRLDPTPSASIDLNLEENNRFIQFKVLLDTINYYWNVFVIDYNLQRQLIMMKKLKERFKEHKIDLRFNYKAVIKYLIAAAAIGLVIVLLYGVFYRRKSAQERLINIFLRKIQQRGYNKQRNQGLEEFVSTLKGKELKTAAEAFVYE